MTHRGRYLLAKVTDVSGFWCISSGSVLLEDINGMVVEVAVYNTDESKFPQNFHLGRELCIMEPFYKVRADGTVGIRVDKPETEIFDHPWPRSSVDWKELGNKFIKVRHSTMNIIFISYRSWLRPMAMGHMEIYSTRLG